MTDVEKGISALCDEIAKLRDEIKNLKSEKDPFGFEYTAFKAGVRAGVRAGLKAARCRAVLVGEQYNKGDRRRWVAEGIVTNIDAIDPDSITLEEIEETNND